MCQRLPRQALQEHLVSIQRALEQMAEDPLTAKQRRHALKFKLAVGLRFGFGQNSHGGLCHVSSDI